jgi:hypothetical protein
MINCLLQSSDIAVVSIRLRLPSFHLDETNASDHAPIARFTKDIDVLAVVIAELKFGHVQRHVWR